MKASSSTERNLNIGIWCDYGFTLAPSEGIGVFVSNLVLGLGKLESVASCTLIANAVDWQVLKPLEMAFPNKVRIIRTSQLSWMRRRILKTLRRWKRRLDPTGSGKSLLWRSLQFVESWLDVENHKNLELSDVWLIPYVGLDLQIDHPNIVVVHDLVTYHYPQGANLRRLQNFKRLVSERVAQATLVACMAEYIRQNDLLNTLGLPFEKTRVVRFAVPQDIPENSDESSLLNHKLGTERIILFPSAFRTYKNHALLIQALAKLESLGEKNWQVVFTGIRECPNSLNELSTSLNVSDRVHSLGKVSRSALSHLYKTAFVTVLPSLYEQGSFPLLEALSFGCPVMSSDIPSMREQFDSMLEDVPFFDPMDPGHFVDCLLQLAKNRDLVKERQMAGFQNLLRYTWVDAAGKWVEVFRDAMKVIPTN